jgi:hypothetical protein
VAANPSVLAANPSSFGGESFQFWRRILPVLAANPSSFGGESFQFWRRILPVSSFPSRHQKFTDPQKKAKI